MSFEDAVASFDQCNLPWSCGGGPHPVMTYRHGPSNASLFHGKGKMSSRVICFKLEWLCLGND